MLVDNKHKLLCSATWYCSKRTGVLRCYHVFRKHSKMGGGFMGECAVSSPVNLPIGMPADAPVVAFSKAIVDMLMYTRPKVPPRRTVALLHPVMADVLTCMHGDADSRVGGRFIGCDRTERRLVQKLGVVALRLLARALVAFPKTAVTH